MGRSGSVTTSDHGTGTQHARDRLRAIEARARMLRAIRAWLDARGFLEVETPTLFAAPGLNPHIAEFETEFRESTRRRQRLWLRTSPEVFHKRLLADGAERIYEIGRFYRNGERGKSHNPEFTGLELYQANTDYRAIMETTEQLIAEVFAAFAGHPSGDISLPWDRLTVRQAFRRHAGLTALPDDLPSLRAEATRIGIPTAPDDRYDDVFFRIYLERVEPKLGHGKPVFLLDYPASMAVMARRKPSDPSLAERVELYVTGVECGNGFSELTEPAEQRARFLEDRRAIAEAYGVPEDSLPLDEDFLDALSRMPPSSGIAIGLDRILALALGETDLAKVIAFPFPDRAP